jgi:RimJ/RimL family protein N-acetyltransferase
MLMEIDSFLNKNFGQCSICSLNFYALAYEDLEFFLEVRNNVRHNLHNNSEFSINETQNWFRNSSEQKYVICQTILGGKKIGYFRFNLIEEDNLQVGLDLHPLNQGKGLGTSLYLCLLNHWIIPKKIKKLSLRVLSCNKIAVKLYSKVGFKLISKAEIFRDKEIINDYYMELEL